jgi:3-phosphoshikimate 1-carboxyvinyltransferase
MAVVTLHPGRLMGSLAVPPSKSVAHRAIVCAALSYGESLISPVDDSQDMQAMLQCMAALGADYTREGRLLQIRGQSHKPEGMPVLDCMESGNTLRFLMPLSLVLAGGGRFLTGGRLAERPLGPYEALFARQGIAFDRMADGFFVKGIIVPGRFELPGNVSSQFITGLLLALPLLNGDSEILLTTLPESEAYLQLTMDTMADFGVQVQRPDPQRFLVPGGQSYRPLNFTVEGDYSQAAVMLCAGALGSNVAIRGLNFDSHQGDKAVTELLIKMGADFVREDGACFMKANSLHGIRIDGGQFPDILPMMALVCCLSKGESLIENAGRLRLKECDRFAATVQELSGLGADIRAEGDSMVIHGREKLTGGVLADSHNDHRMAMMLSIAALHCREPVSLENPSCVKKTWPGYWDDYKALGGIIS